MAADGTITLKTSIDKTGATKDLNSLLSELNTSISKGIVISVGVSGASEAVNAAKEITAESERAEKATKRRSNASKKSADEEISATERIEGLYKTLEEIRTKYTAAVNSGNAAQAESYRKLESDLYKYVTSIDKREKAEKRLKSVGEGDSRYGKIQMQIASANSEASKFEQNLISTIQAAKKLGVSFAEFGALEQFKEGADAVTEFNNAVAESSKTLDTNSSSLMQNIEAISQLSYSDWVEPTTSQKKNIANIQKTIAEIEKQKLAASDAKLKLKELYDQREALGGAGKDIALDTSIADQEQKLAAATSKIDFKVAELQRFSDTLAKSGVSLESVRAILENYGVTVSSVTGRTESLSRAESEVATSAGSASSAIERTSTEASSAAEESTRLTRDEIRERERLYERLFEEAELRNRIADIDTVPVTGLVEETTTPSEPTPAPMPDIAERTEEVREYTEAVTEAGERTRETSSAEEEMARRLGALRYAAEWGMPPELVLPDYEEPTYSRIEEDIRTLQDKIISETERGNTAQAESYRKLLSDISSYYKKIGEIESLNKKKESTTGAEYESITAQIGKAQADVEKFAASITDTIKNAHTLNIRLTGIKSLDPFRDAAASAREAANTSAEYGRQMANAASESGNATSAVQQFQQIYEKALRDGNTVQANIVASMQKTISGIEHQNVLTDKYKQKLAELYAQQRQIGGEGVDIKLDTEIADYTQKLAQAQANTSKLTSELQRLSDKARASKVNLSSAESTLRKYGTTAKNAGVQTTGLRGKILQLYKSATSGSKAATKSTNGFAGSLNKVSERFKGLASRVFVFSVWTMAMRGLRNTIASVLKGNEEFNNSLEQLKASLWTAISPIINLVVPILTKLVQWITAAITAITKFIAKLAGISYESLVKGGKALSKQASGYDDVADSADKAKKAQDRYLASFDKINKAQDTSQDTSDKEVTQPSPFDSLGKSTLSKEVEEQLNKVMAIIGGALMAVGVIMCLAGAIPVGIQLILTGAALLFGAAAIAWDSTNKEVKKTIETIMKVIAISLLAIGVILLCVGNLPLGIMLVIIGALAMYGSEQLDKTKTSKTIGEVLTEIALVVGAALLSIGVILLCVGNIPLGIALVVAGLAIGAAALKFGEVSEKTKEMITTIALIAGTALLVLGVILVCFGIFPLGIGLIVAGAGSLGVAMLTGKDTVLKVITNIWNGIKGFWNKHIAKIFTAQFWRAKFSAIGNGLKTAVKAALNGLIWIINKFIDGLNLMLIPQRVLIMSIAKLFGSDLSLGDIKIPHIPQLAKGGIVPTQTLAMIGERGKEAVIPLENNLGWLDKMSDMIASKVGAGESTINLTIQLDGSVIYKDIVKRNREATRRTGKNALV